jgi:dipeptidyl aminopeptidase/acylaminoacyl peptidase
LARGVALVVAGLFAIGLLLTSNLRAAENDTAKKPAPTTEELTTWLSPYRTEQVTLAPDGRHLAYTVHEDDQTMIVIVDVDEPAKKAVVPVGPDMIIRSSHDKERTLMRVPFLRWVGAGRLVFQAELPSLEEVDIKRSREPTNISVVYAVDADGRHLAKLADEDNLTLLTDSGNPLPRQPRVIDVAADVPDAILVEASRPVPPRNGDTSLIGNDSTDPAYYGRLATSLYQINVRTGQRKVLHEQDVNGSLLYDHQGQARIQFNRPIDRAEQRFISVTSPGRKVSRELDQLLGDPITPDNLLGTRTFPVAFDYDPDILYVASNAGRDTYGLYGVNLRTRQRTAVAVENSLFDLAKFGDDAPGVASSLVFDPGRRRLVGVRVTGLEGRITQWIDPELTGLQSQLDRAFPGRSVEVINWDDARARFLLFVSSTGDPGRYYLYQPADNHFTQVVRRAPGVDPEKTNAARAFTFTAAGGVPLTGYLTVPRQPFRPLPPLMVFLHGGPWERDEPGFNRDAQAFAAMGFVVVQVNYRGSAGFGTRIREGLRETMDEVPLADVRAALAWAGANATFDHKRIALVGEGFGGYLVLRALQRYPDEFRCAVAINAPTDLEVWSRKPESSRENTDQLEVAARVIKQEQDFFLGAMPRAQSAASRTIPSFALDGMGSIDELQQPIGAPFPAGRPIVPPGTGNEEPGAAAQNALNKPPPPVPVKYVNFASEFRYWYFGGDAKRLAALSPARHADEITKPVLLIQDPEDAGGEAGTAGAMRSALTRAGNPPEYLAITGEFTRGLPKARLQVLTAIEEFFVVNIYEFGVKIGPLKVKK